MRAVIILVVLGTAAVSGLPKSSKIIGGSETTIDQYAFAAALLTSPMNNGIFAQACGGTIINNRAILSAAHCFFWSGAVSQWNIRVGSTFANSGGVVHSVSRIINHPNYDSWSQDNDIAVLHSSTAFSFNNQVRVGSIAGANYNLADNQIVWAIGWGLTAANGQPSERLRHVQIWSINQAICRQRYTAGGMTITDNMLCSGWLDVGGRDQCTQDSGGPLLHNNVVVGVCSFGIGCADPFYPGVNARVSRYTSWISSNA